MRNAGKRIACADIHYPFPENCGIYQSFPPKRVRQLLRTRQYLSEVGMRDESDHRRPQRCKVMVHSAEVKAVEVGYVARHMKGHDLPGRCVGNLMPAQEAIQEQAAL